MEEKEETVGDHRSRLETGWRGKLIQCVLVCIAEDRHLTCFVSMKRYRPVRRRCRFWPAEVDALLDQLLKSARRSSRYMPNKPSHAPPTRPASQSTECQVPSSKRGKTGS